MTGAWRRAEVYVKVSLLTTCMGATIKVVLKWTHIHLIITIINNSQYTEQKLTPKDSPPFQLRAMQGKNLHTCNIRFIHNNINLGKDIG